jgi:hypothetical protein
MAMKTRKLIDVLGKKHYQGLTPSKRARVDASAVNLMARKLKKDNPNMSSINLKKQLRFLMEKGTKKSIKKK